MAKAGAITSSLFLLIWGLAINAAEDCTQDFSKLKPRWNYLEDYFFAQHPKFQALREFIEDSNSLIYQAQGARILHNFWLEADRTSKSKRPIPGGLQIEVADKIAVPGGSFFSLSSTSFNLQYPESATRYPADWTQALIQELSKRLDELQDSSRLLNMRAIKAMEKFIQSGLQNKVHTQIYIEDDQEAVEFLKLFIQLLHRDY